MLELLMKYGADPNWRDKMERTSLHIAVNANNGSSDASAEVEAFLITSGADVYAMDVRKRLPLHYVFVKIGRCVFRAAVFVYRGSRTQTPQCWWYD